MRLAGGGKNGVRQWLFVFILFSQYLYKLHLSGIHDASPSFDLSKDGEAFAISLKPDKQALIGRFARNNQPPCHRLPVSSRLDARPGVLDQFSGDFGQRLFEHLL